MQRENDIETWIEAGRNYEKWSSVDEKTDVYKDTAKIPHLDPSAKENTRLELTGQLAALHNAALVSETDLLGTITFANDTFCAISKYTREELIGQNHRILKSGKQPDRIFDELWRTISTSRFWRGDICNRAKDGTLYWVMATITPVLGADGKPIKYIGVRFDITAERTLKEELKVRIEELRATEEELKAVNEELQETNTELESAKHELFFQKRELLYRMQAVNNAVLVSETNLAGDITFANDAFCRISGYGIDELIGQNHRILKSHHQPDEMFIELWQTISTGKTWNGNIKNKKKNNEFYWVRTSITPVLGPDRKPTKYISIRTDVTKQVNQEEELKKLLAEQKQLNAELNAAKELIEQAYDQTKNELKDSIVYAERIQLALMPSGNKFCARLPSGYEAFVFFLARDRVGGDFYWIGGKGTKTVVAVGDGTGHGVPGAFMSILGIGALNKAVEDGGIIPPSKILDGVDEEIKRGLRQTGDSTDIQDSLEMSICTIGEDGTVKLGSAMRFVLRYSRGTLEEISGDRRPVGGTLHGDTPFTEKQIQLLPGDILYMFSDGYFSQLGGHEERPRIYGRKRFKELLLHIAELDMKSQRSHLEDDWFKWKGEIRRQTDDIVVVGIHYTGNNQPRL